MAMWSKTNTITSEDLFEFFPDQCFPDIDGLELRIGEKALHIIGTDSEWALQSDITLAAGPGRMSFFYAGELRFQVEHPEGMREVSMAEAQQARLPQPEDVRFIKRGTPWEFIFSIPEQKTMRIFADITAISWNPAEEE
ncbi:MAG: hypothetical protein LBB60_05385 [Desulfovibrio sp.]|jgi:hypothetical protein|nr:hypothetical protein [Desulfovibrio sp.]